MIHPDKAREREIVKHNQGRGILVLVRDGKYGAVVTVHGVNSSPVTVAPLASSAPNDQAILSFAYDDGHKRLGQSGTDLADNLRQWARQHPGQSLQIRAHCMGARVAIDAIHKLDQQGALPERVKLDLVAPAAAGFVIANMAAPVPDAIAKYIHNTVPAKDMGTWCKFQRDLQKAHLPRHVETRVFLTDHDKFAKPHNARIQKLIRNLNAQRVDVPGHDHLSIIEAAGQIR